MPSRPATAFLAAASLLLAGCAGERHNLTLHRHRAARSLAFDPGSSAKGEIAPPTWVDHPPRLPGYHYFVGESTDAPRKDDALEKAWVSAFVRIGMTEFPELAAIETRSVEGIKNASFERKFVLKLEHIDWSGIREASDLGSPFIDFDDKSGHYVVYRLLRWADADMELARKKVLALGVYRLPSPPEISRKEEKKLVDTLHAVEELNERIEHRDKLLDEVFKSLRCGTTIDDLNRILGGPDRYNPYNGMIVDKEYYWGLYKVERYADNPNITVVTKEDGVPKRRVICPGLVQSDDE